MATIKQITKQIETATKRIADFGRKIDMYRERRDKNIASANKKFGTDIKVDDIISEICGNARYQWNEYRMPASIRDVIGFDAAYKITDAYNAMEENIKKQRIENANLDRLKAELAALEAQAKADADNYNNGLDAALRSAMADFRVVWFDRMMTWFGNHFDIIKKRTPEMKERRARVRSLQYYFDTFRHRIPHYKVRNFLERTANVCNEIILDDANRYETREEYLAAMKEELEKSWERGIVNLTKKCQAFGVDESKVSTCAPELTEKGFEVIIRDGQPRVIHARVIWAAEYSDIVQPHTRYIVTERAAK